jgi:general secretion pathway protein L
MSPLIISLPLSSASPASLYSYTGSAGEPVRNASASLLPLAGRGAEVVAVVPVQALSWFMVDLPAGKALRGVALRNALVGLLEDRLLSEPESLHFALQPGWLPGQRVAVAVCQKAWLQNHLLALESAGKTVTRIVPAMSPARSAAEAQSFACGTPQDAWLWTSDATGVWGLPFGAGRSAWVAALQTAGGSLSAEPAVAEMTALALQQVPALVQPAQSLMQAAQSDWDLAQLDLAATGRARWAKDWSRLQQSLWQSPAWRPARWGLGVLLVSQLVGLNAWAWKLQTDWRQRQAGLTQVMRQSFPQVQLVIDAPLQMAREVQNLRQSSGHVGVDGLEPLLAAVGQVAPAGQNIERLDFDNGTLRIQGWSLSDDQEQDLRNQLMPWGLSARRDGTQWLITRRE